LFYGQNVNSRSRSMSAPPKKAPQDFWKADLAEPDIQPKPKNVIVPMPKLENAGQFEYLTERGAEVTETLEQHMFTGLQVTLQNLLHPNFATVHTLQLGKKENVDPMTGKKDDERALYMFTAFLKTKFWLLTSTASSKVTRASVQYERGWFAGKMSGQFATDERKTAWEADATVSKGDTCLQAKFQPPAYGFSYTQPISSAYAIGAEMMLSLMASTARLKWVGKHENKPANSTTTVSYATGIGPDGVAINYTKGLLDNLDVITELDMAYSTKNKNWESVYKFGYNLKSDKTGGGSVKALVTSAGQVLCLTEQPLSDMAILQICGKINYPKNIYDFGFGVMMSM